jgi:hypothetical protein
LNIFVTLLDNTFVIQKEGMHVVRWKEEDKRTSKQILLSVVFQTDKSKRADHPFDHVKYCTE